MAEHAPIPANDAARLAALRSYDILDTEAEGSFDDVVHLAADLCDAPIALVSLVDEDRQWFKACCGLDAQQTPRCDSFCGHAIVASDGLFEVANALEDPRFFDNPLVAGAPHIRFYAGKPLVDEQGYRLGTLCVIDRRPRQLTDRQHRGLEALASQVVTHLTLRRRTLEYRRMSEAAEQASRAKSQFLATMSHEIRTPLNGVIGATQLLSETDLSADQRELLDTVLKSGQTLLHLLDDLLDLSRLDAGRVKLESTAFSVRDVVRGVMGLFAPAAADRSTVIRSDVPDDLVMRGDEHRVRQVLGNLVSNAVKFTEGGTVDIRVRVDGPQVEFEVQDTGIGMSDEQRQRLFQPFEQGDASVTRRFGGSGLGLAICRRLCELMGGSIDGEGTEGRGSTFRFRLPYDRARRPDRSPPPSIAPRFHTPPRILLAEDNDVNAKVAKRMLQRLGCSVEWAPNGQAALDLLRSRSFDVALLDLHMPVMGGVEAAHQAPDSDAVLIALTASVTEEDRAACRDAGMRDFLTKPVSRDALVGMLWSFCRHLISHDGTQPAAIV
jgi:signal transduction histidine kinase